MRMLEPHSPIKNLSKRKIIKASLEVSWTTSCCLFRLRRGQSLTSSSFPRDLFKCNSWTKTLVNKSTVELCHLRNSSCSVCPLRAISRTLLKPQAASSIKQLWTQWILVEFGLNSSAIFWVARSAGCAKKVYSRPTTCAHSMSLNYSSSGTNSIIIMAVPAGTVTKWWEICSHLSLHVAIWIIKTWSSSDRWSCSTTTAMNSIFSRVIQIRTTLVAISSSWWQSKLSSRTWDRQCLFNTRMAVSTPEWWWAKMKRKLKSRNPCLTPSSLSSKR